MTNKFQRKNLFIQNHIFKFIAKRKSNIMGLVMVCISSSIFLSTGCCFSNCKPRLRLGAYFGAPLGIEYPNPEKLGKHGYTKFWGERIGLVYTCKGGFIDLGHLRDSADRTKYCTEIAYKNLIRGITEFSFSLMEPSKFFVKIKYPEYWDDMLDKEVIAKDIAIIIGQNLACNSMVWHEIITWYGYKYTGVFSEYISSFSWEDVYSDVIGIELAGMALKNNSENYNVVMTKLIYDKLYELDVQPVSIAKKAENIVKGKWYKGTIYPFTELKKRNLDIGINDGYVTPWLIPGICENSKPFSCAVPDKYILDEYGFTIDIKIEPKIAEEYKLLSIVYPDGNGKYIIPDSHFPLIMQDILEKEIERNGPEVNVPNL